MSDEQFFYLLLKVAYYSLAGVAFLMGLAWAARGWVSRRQIDGLKAENETLKSNVKLAETAARAEIDVLKSHVALMDDRRALAEDRLKATEHDLAKVKTQLETAGTQAARGEPSEALGKTISLALGSANNAINESSGARQALSTQSFFEGLKWFDRDGNRQVFPEGTGSDDVTGRQGKPKTKLGTIKG